MDTFTSQVTGKYVHHEKNRLPLQWGSCDILTEEEIYTLFWWLVKYTQMV